MAVLSVVLVVNGFMGIEPKEQEGQHPLIVRGMKLFFHIERKARYIHMNQGSNGTKEGGFQVFSAKVRLGNQRNQFRKLMLIDNDSKVEGNQKKLLVMREERQTWSEQHTPLDRGQQSEIPSELIPQHVSFSPHSH